MVVQQYYLHTFKLKKLLFADIVVLGNTLQYSYLESRKALALPQAPTHSGFTQKYPGDATDVI